MGLMESGDLRVLAVTAGERLDIGEMAEVPTCREEGIGAEFSNWRGIFGPADMPESCPGVLGEYAAGDDGDEGVAGDLQQVRMGDSLPGARGV